MKTDDKYIKTEKLINEALRTPLSINLPDNFAGIVASKAVRRFAWKHYFREFLVYFYSFLGLVAVTVSVAFILLGADWQIWKQFLVDNSSLIISLKFLALFVLFADKVLLQYFMYRYSRKYELHELH